jgi:hypothetical protein
MSLAISCLMLPALGAAQSVARVNVWPDGSALPLFGIYQPVIDPNGRFVVFVGQDIWLKDLETGVVDRIVTLRNLAYGASVSADGRFLILIASEESLAPGASKVCANGLPCPELYLLELSSRVIVRVQLPPEVVAMDPPPIGAVSADLRWAVYATQQGMLLHDRASGTTTLISQGSGASLSDDGRRVLFQRSVSLVERTQVFVYDRASGTVDRVDVGAPILDEGRWSILSTQISGDGRFAVFNAFCLDCVSTVRRLFIRDLDWRRTWELVRGMDGTLPDRAGVELRDINRDGRFVIFESGSSNLVPDDPTFSDLFVIDRITRRIVRLNGDHRGGSTSLFASVTADGLRVVFGAPPLFSRFPGAGPTLTPPISLSALDVDRDEMQDDWERFVGLSPANPGDGAEDSNHDGVLNLDEFYRGSQPRARFQFRTRGANVDPETSRILLRNRGETAGAVWLRLVDAAGLSSAYPITVAPHSTLVVPITEIPDRPRGPFLLHVTSDVLISPGLSQ